VELAKNARNLNFNPAAVRKYVEDNFSIARMARDYITVYENALRQREEKRIA
jgi:hypothetical protein